MTSFAAVLDGAPFPLRRWQIVATADGYGIDARTRAKLVQIPDREYASPSDVMIALTSTPAHLAGRRPL